MPCESLLRQLLCGLLFAALLSAGPAGRADIKLPTGGGVRAFPAKVQVEPGGTVTIPLTGSVASKSKIQFFIREAPKHGQLGEIKQINRERATVTYTHDGKSSGDRFRYSAKIPGKPVSPSSPVLIEVIPPEATTFPLPQFIDFGTHFAGDVWVESLTLTTSQKMPVNMEIDAPWQVDGTTRFTLEPGKPVNVSLVFVPGEQRKYLGYLRFPGTTFPVVRLHGEALAPMAVSAESLTIPADPEIVVEKLLIANITGEDREVQIETSENLEAPPLLPIAAEGEHEIPFRYTGPRNRAGAESLTIRMGAWSVSVEVEVEPGPASWAWAGEPLRELEAITSSEVIPLEFQVRNTGGTAGKIMLDSSQTALILESPQAVVLPDENHTFTAYLHPSKMEAGDFQIRVKAEIEATATGTLPPILVQGFKPVREPPPIASAPLAAATPAFTQAENLPETVAWKSRRNNQSVKVQGGIKMREPVEFDPDLPVIDEIVSRGFLKGNRDYQLVWNAPDGGPYSFAVDVQYLRRNILSWWPIQDLRFEEAGKTVSTTLRDLAPGHSYLLRIRTVTGDGQSSAPSPVIRVDTPLAQSFPWRWSLIALILLAFAAGGVWRWRQNHPREVERRPAML